jgi:hypothetical protein
MGLKEAVLRQHPPVIAADERGSGKRVARRVDVAEVQTAQGKLYLFVAIDRASKFAVAQLVNKANT